METTGARGPQSLVDQWRELTARRVRIWNALEQALEEQHGLSCHEFEVLDQLSECTEEMKPRVQDIADVVPITQSALSRLIGRLEKQGLIERKLCEVDRRGINVYLTDAGRARHAEARPTYCEVLAQQFASCAAAEAAGLTLGLGELFEARKSAGD
ncbi:MarR family transcriptional regulator [Micromonospora sp. C28SCA-DRY-2]|uniref:MarR family winged helix-turn-helix transcriptional regulator n=1 Tax=Micromonospora sp. C28SCA-DRY-2 TaxID=3059522 RepID=UPI002676C906|nr:MarR family transcriptional regulator [Micromonospora sp. C28SCA-DRY-2]MDO3703227.1 MarR family transcriptional regulator [Micromonospora sp. C28SCA-DRY-2]